MAIIRMGIKQARMKKYEGECKPYEGTELLFLFTVDSRVPSTVPGTWLELKKYLLEKKRICHHDQKQHHHGWN